MPIKSTSHIDAAAVRKIFRNIPRVAGTEAVNHFKSSFRLQGFYDNSLQRWRPRKPGAKNNRGRAILVRSGAFRRSIRVIKYEADGVGVGSDLPYAKAHNEGISINRQVGVRTHARKAHTRTWNGKKQSVAKSIVNSHQRKMNLTLPRRRVIGNSGWLNRKIDIRVLKLIRNELKQ